MKGNNYYNYNTVDDLLNNTYRPNESKPIDVDWAPVEDTPAAPEKEEKPLNMIPGTTLAADPIMNLDDLHEMLKGGKDLVLKNDGTFGEEGDGEKPKADNLPRIPGTVVGGEDEAEGEEVVNPPFDYLGDFVEEPQSPVIPPAICGAPTAGTWYERNPQLLAAEVLAMRQLLGRPVSPYVKPNGQLYWKVTLTPNIGHGIPPRTYHLEMVYDKEHPKRMWGSSVHALPVPPGPTIEDMKREIGGISWIKNKRLPHLVSYSGVLYLCTSDRNKVGTDLNEGITTAATAVRYAYRYLVAYEAAIRDPKIWEDFQREGAI